MLSDISVHKSVIKSCIALLCLFALTICVVGCDSDRGIDSDSSRESESVSIPDDIIPDDYIRDAVIEDGDYHCRVYKGQLLLHLGGKEYFAAGNYSEQMNLDLGEYKNGYIQYTDKDIQTLKTGDTFAYDRDIRFTIDSLDVEDWNCKANDILQGCLTRVI